MTGGRGATTRWTHHDDVSDWLVSILRRLTADPALPLYGSQEWHAAPDPVRLASALRAAEAWRLQGLYLAQDVKDELAATRWVEECRDAQEWAELGAWVRRMANSPTHAELVERRQQVVRLGVAS